MPYIGKEPVAGNFVLLDSITTSATATYALTKDSVAYSPESPKEYACFVKRCNSST